MIPTLVQHVHRDWEQALGSLWTDVTRADGAVGFLTDEPEDDIRAAASRAVHDLRAGRLQLISVDAGGELAGVVFLERGEAPRKDHVATVLRLMVHPSRQGEGLGRALLAAAAAHAAASGLEQLLLAVRGGTSLPDFYRACGWTEVGVFPGVLHLGGADRRDEHWFHLPL